MTEAEFEENCKNEGIILKEGQLRQLRQYYINLIEYNSHTNLTRITEEKEVYLKHYYDSLMLVKIVKVKNQSICDIGSGAGFPGIVLKIVFPDTQITLIDSSGKKVKFLNEVIKKLELQT